MSKQDEIKKLMNKQRNQTHIDLLNKKISENTDIDLPSTTIDKEVLEVLWNLFQAIGMTWTENIETETMKYQFENFIEFRISIAQKYGDKYLNASIVLGELFKIYGKEETYYRLLLNGDLNQFEDDNRLADVKTYVVDEFIKVFLTLGGFKYYGARNYNSFMGGVRGSMPPPYRTVRD